MAGLAISTAGWHTIVNELIENGDGLTLERRAYVRSSNGTAPHSNLNLRQVALADIVGWRCGWWPANSLSQMLLAFDNTQSDVIPPPGPALSGAIGLGLVGEIKRRFG